MQVVFNDENGVCHYMRCINFPLNVNATIPIWNPDHYTTKKNLMQELIPCKCIMHKHAKDKIFLYFYNGWYVKFVIKERLYNSQILQQVSNTIQ